VQIVDDLFGDRSNCGVLLRDDLSDIAVHCRENLRSEAVHEADGAVVASYQAPVR
jgi:hypothetical protein